MNINELGKFLLYDVKYNFIHIYQHTKVGCVYPMVVVSILPHAEFEPNDHQEDAYHFT